MEMCWTRLSIVCMQPLRICSCNHQGDNSECYLLESSINVGTVPCPSYFDVATGPPHCYSHGLLLHAAASWLLLLLLLAGWLLLLTTYYC